MTNILEAQIWSQELIKRIGLSYDLSDLVAVPLSLASSILDHFENLGINPPWEAASVGIESNRAILFKTIVTSGCRPNTEFIIQGLGQDNEKDFKCFLSGFAVEALSISRKISSEAGS